MRRIFNHSDLDRLADAVLRGDAPKLRKLLAKQPELLRTHPRESAELVCLALAGMGSDAGVTLVTPLEEVAAAYEADRGAYDALFEYGADAGAVGTAGQPPILVAAQMSHPMFLEDLLKRGVDPNATTPNKWTAASLVRDRQNKRSAAQRHKDEPFLEILRRYGAA